MRGQRPPTSINAGPNDNSTEEHAGLMAAVDWCSVLIATTTTTGQELADQLSLALQSLVAAWAVHVKTTEAPDGLLAELKRVSPRDTPAVDALRAEHRTLAAAIRAVQLRVIAEDGQPSRPTLQQTGAILLTILDHDHKGADLIWRAYNVDVGDS